MRWRGKPKSLQIDRSDSASFSLLQIRSVSSGGRGWPPAGRKLGTAASPRSLPPRSILRENSMARSKTASRNARKTVARHRTLQRRRTRDDRRHPAEEAEAMQAGARRYPVPPMPRQHQRKPGHETRLDPRADVRGAILERLVQAARQGGADHGRRFRNRPGGGSAIRARGRRRRHRPSGRARGRRRYASRPSRQKAGAAW